MTGHGANCERIHDIYRVSGAEIPRYDSLVLLVMYLHTTRCTSLINDNHHGIMITHQDYLQCASHLKILPQ